MTRDDIIRMAREADFFIFDAKLTADHLGAQLIADAMNEIMWSTAERFAHLVAQAEREECAKLCEAQYVGNRRPYGAKVCAEAIRNRRQA